MIRQRFAAYRNSLQPANNRPRSELSRLVEECKNANIPVYEFLRWHHLRRNKVGGSGLPLIVDGWANLQTDWSINFPGAPVGLDYAKDAMEKSGRIPEAICVSIYDGSSYLRPGEGKPSKNYPKDIKMIEGLLKMGIQYVMIGNAGAEIRFNHLPGQSQFTNRSIEFIDKLRRLWGNRLWVAVSHSDTRRDILHSNGEVTSWMADNNITNVSMCGYSWLYDLDHPVNMIWKRKDEANPGLGYSRLNQSDLSLISSYIKMGSFGTGLGGKTGLRHDSPSLASKFGFKFATVSFQ